MNAVSVRYVADDLVSRSVDHYRVGRMGNIKPMSGTVDRKRVPAALASDTYRI